MSEKKGATCQSFIRKEITTYRIGTLTSDAMKLKVNTEVYHYCVYFDFHCIRRYDKIEISNQGLFSELLFPELRFACMYKYNY